MTRWFTNPVGWGIDIYRVESGPDVKELLRTLIVMTSHICCSNLRAIYDSDIWKFAQVLRESYVRLLIVLSVNIRHEGGELGSGSGRAVFRYSRVRPTAYSAFNMYRFAPRTTKWDLGVDKGRHRLTHLSFASYY